MEDTKACFIFLSSDNLGRMMIHEEKDFFLNTILSIFDQKTLILALHTTEHGGGCDVHRAPKGGRMLITNQPQLLFWTQSLRTLSWIFTRFSYRWENAASERWSRQPKIAEKAAERGLKLWNGSVAQELSQLALTWVCLVRQGNSRITLYWDNVYLKLQSCRNTGQGGLFIGLRQGGKRWRGSLKSRPCCLL